MKKINYFSILLGAVFFSCAGNDTQSSTEVLNQPPSDTLSGHNQFADFTQYVKSLEPLTEQVDSALNKYESLKEFFTVEQKDSAFFIVMDFMESFEISDEDIEELTEESQNKIEKKYSKAGFTIWWEEGYPYPMPDIKFLESKFKKDFSAELDDYVDVLKKTYHQTTSDAGLSIGWSNLGEQIIFCEEYLTENQESKYSAKVLSIYSERMEFLMWGLDNTPIIDSWTDETQLRLDEDVSEVYQKLIKDDKHKTGKIIADHLAWLESRNFQYEYEEVEYLSDDDIKLYLGLE